MDLSDLLPALIGSAFLMLTCWTLGRFDYSILWVLLFVILNACKWKLWKDRQRRVIALQQGATREKEVVLAQLRDLPAWVQFPDTERVEWINKVIYQLWPYIGEYSRKFIKEIVEPQIKSHMPNVMKSFRFQEIDIGDIPLRVSGIKVYTENVGRDRIVMDMDVAYAGDCEFVVAMGALKGGLRQVQFKGKLRAILTPLIPQPPLIGGVSLFFLDVPTVDFDLTGLGEFIELPILITTVRNIINEQISSICVLPNQIVVPLTMNTDIVQMYFQDPAGVIRIHCIEARNVENKDMILQGKSDPFTRFSVGAQAFQTKTIDNTLNPKWGEIFEAIVDQRSGQKLIAEVFDDDLGKNDDFLGRTTVELGLVAEKGYLDQWYQLEGVKHGDLHLAITWMNLLQNFKAPVTTSDANKLLSSALLMIYVDSVSNLPSSKLDFEPSPFVEMTLGKKVLKTFPKPKTRNPLYRQRFMFLVTNVEFQTLKIEAKDESNAAKSLGEYSIDLKLLLKEDNFELFQRTVYLILGPHSSPLVISVRLRFLEEAIRSSFQPTFASNESSYTNKSNICLSKNLIGNNMQNYVVSQPSIEVDSKDLLSSSLSMAHRNSGSPSGTLRLRKLKRHKSRLYESDGPLGILELSLKYSSDTMKLVVFIKRANNLKPYVKDGPMNPYVSVKLLINGVVTLKKKTATFVKTTDAEFCEQLTFDLDKAIYSAATLIIDVKDGHQSSWIRETPVIGQIIFDLAKLKVDHVIESCFDIHEPCYWRDQ